MKISIVIPVYNMDGSARFLKRNLDSIKAQNFKDYEIVVTDDSEDSQLADLCSNYNVRYLKNTGKKGMANNTNFAIDQAQGDLIKILFQDDYFYTEDSLGEIVKHFTPSAEWLVTSCTHQIDNPRQVTGNPHKPFYSDSENTIGSPSVLTIRKDVTARFDPQFQWVLDLDLYKQLYRLYGSPKILQDINVVIGLGDHQTTNHLTDEFKIAEHQLLKQKYDSRT